MTYFITFFKLDLVREWIMSLIRIDGKALNRSNIWPIVFLCRWCRRIGLQTIHFILCWSVQFSKWLLNGSIKLRIIFVLIWNLVIKINVIIGQNSKIGIYVGIILGRHVDVKAVFWTLIWLIWSWSSTNTSSSDPNILVVLSSKWHVVLVGLSWGNKVHLVNIGFNVEVGLITIAFFLEISSVTHVVVIVSSISVTLKELITFSLLIIEYISQVLILQLENMQAIDAKNTTNFRIHLLARFDLLTSWLVP